MHKRHFPLSEAHECFVPLGLCPGPAGFEIENYLSLKLKLRYKTH